MSTSRRSDVKERIADVPLFWQCWKLDSQLVASITDAVRSAAAELNR